jgi:DNA-binding response OmpR family regulator
MRVLVVEDDSLVASGLKEGLTSAGYTVDVAASAEEAEQFVNLESFNIALVDIGLPVRDGLDFVQSLRIRGNGMPVLMLTALSSIDATVRGLDAGADDYMPKPFRFPELLARMRAIIRRAHQRSEALLRHNDLTLDTRARTVHIGGVALDLTNREWTVLEMLLMASPAIVSKDTLTNSLAGWDKDITANAVEVHISRLRTKLADADIHLRTVRGIGYRIDAPNR